MILFNEDDHIYWNSDTGEQYESVTTLIHRYSNEFDADKAAKTYLKNRPHLDKTEEEIKQEWIDFNKKAIHKGSRYHDTKEIETLFLETKLDRDYNDHLQTLENLPDGTYPELRLYNHWFKKAGTADIVKIKKPYAFIYDHKTNEKALSKEGFKKQTMKSPLDYIQDANYYHYLLQLNIYAWMLEQYGYKPIRLEIFHKRFVEGQEIPDKYISMWKGSREEQEEELRKVKNIVFPYYPLRVKSFLEYDYERSS